MTLAYFHIFLNQTYFRRASVRIQGPQKHEALDDNNTTPVDSATIKNECIEDGCVSMNTVTPILICSKLSEVLPLSNVLADKHVADIDDKTLWRREKHGKNMFSIGTQSDISVKHLCQPMQAIVVKSKPVRSRGFSSKGGPRD